MSKYILTILLILTINTANAGIRFVTEVNYYKQINDNAGYEYLIKGTIPFEGVFDLKLGFSENYTAPRSNPYSPNHHGNRFDVGFYWSFPYDFKVGYTHSIRSQFAGASPIDIFDNDSVDKISIRKEVII